MGARLNLGSFARFAANRESGSDDRWDSFADPVLFADPVAMEKFQRFRQARAVWTEATMQEELRSNVASVDAATMHENQRYHLQGKQPAAGEFNFLQPTISAQPTNSAAPTSARGGVLEEVGAGNVAELRKLAERLRGAGEEARGGGESSSSGRSFNFPISVSVYLFGRGPVFGPFGGAPRLSTAFDAVGAAPVGGLEPPSPMRSSEEQQVGGNGDEEMEMLAMQRPRSSFRRPASTSLPFSSQEGSASEATPQVIAWTSVEQDSF